MKYFKDTNDNNQLYAYEDDATQIKQGLTSISEEEFLKLTSPSEEEILNILKEEKKIQINYEKEQDINSGIKFKNSFFQTRKQDRTNIFNCLLDAKLNDIKTITWLDIDNKEILFSFDEFVQFASNIRSKEQECVFKANNLKTQIINAKTKEELSNINYKE